jgi:hypothetical protein
MTEVYDTWHQRENSPACTRSLPSRIHAVVAFSTQPATQPHAVVSVRMMHCSDRHAFVLSGSSRRRQAHLRQTTVDVETSRPHKTSLRKRRKNIAFFTDSLTHTKTTLVLARVDNSKTIPNTIFARTVHAQSTDAVYPHSTEAHIHSSSQEAHWTVSE